MVVCRKAPMFEQSKELASGPSGKLLLFSKLKSRKEMQRQGMPDKRGICPDLASVVRIDGCCV